MGGSPLTIGAMEQTPLAIAFQETIQLLISGDNQKKYDSNNLICNYLLLSVGKVELRVKCLFHFRVQY
jgi:hypothetical protein